MTRMFKNVSVCDIRRELCYVKKTHFLPPPVQPVHERPVGQSMQSFRTLDEQQGGPKMTCSNKTNYILYKKLFSPC